MNTNRRLSDDELAALLASTPKVEPPAELLQRLLADLPAAPAAPVPVNDTGGPPRRRSWMPLAASLAVMVGGGLVVLRLVQQTPQAPTWTEEQVAPTPGSAPPPALVERLETPAEREQLSPQTAADSAPAELAKTEAARDDAAARREPGAEKRPLERSSTPAADGSASEPREAQNELLQVQREAPRPTVETSVADQPLALRELRQEPESSSGAGRRDSARRPSSAEELKSLGYVAPAAPPSIPAAGAVAPERGRLESADAESGTIPKPKAKKIPIPDPTPEQEAFRDVYVEPTIVNPFVASATDPLSTFALEVDTGSWSMARAWLERGALPPAGAIRVEEALNSYDYGDPSPRRADFALTIEGAPAPWSPFGRTHLVRIGLAARELERGERRPAVLVMLVDVSGSMQQDGRLELVKDALALLLERLRPGDRVGLVTYSNRAQVLLEPTADLETARRAVARLHPQGSTNAEAGLREAYRVAEGWLGRGSDVRVVLCSDGVANVGATGPDSILESLARWKDQGIELTAVGVGLGNYNDALLEQLADRADGRYAYVDDLDEANRIFGDALDGTLSTLAHEARAQVAFDPRQVERWRLIGYENRAMPDSAFRDDQRDGGEIGFGHRVTALYELVLREDRSRRIPLGEVRLRWRPRGQQELVEVAEPIRREDLASSFDRAKPSLRLAASVAGFAEILRGSPWVGGLGLGEVRRWIDDLPRELSRREDVRRLRDLITTARRLGAGGEDEDRPVYEDDEPVGRSRSPVERR
jgi:Ca-activated chloride channel family protein